MEGNEKYKVPTGDICIIEGEKGYPLEFLSIGDYGKEKNLKADFMGLDKEINGVPHGELLPLEEKWVITISSQYGCSMGCTFCDVPKVGPGRNATYGDILTQVNQAVELHPEVVMTKRLNLHYARMGEPTYNRAVIDSAYHLSGYFRSRGWGFHPVVSTMMPCGNHDLLGFLIDWLTFKNNVNGEAGLQLSINTTDDLARARTMPNAKYLKETSLIMYEALKAVGKEQGLKMAEIKGRKITLNFALTDAAIDGEKLAELFNPDYFICKITPMHKTVACVKEGLLTDNGYDHYYPYKKVEESLKKAGFDVIVFIPSKEEDESRITCGNAILSGKRGQDEKN